MKPRSAARAMMGIFVFQLGIGALLVMGDIKGSSLSLPRFTPDAPRLNQPVRPGDQRRIYRPDRDAPQVRPARAPGTLPDRLTLTFEDSQYRLEGAISPDDAPRIITQIVQADPPVQDLIVQSPGGSVHDALELGRHLRTSGINTRILSGEICYSACPYLFAGGAARLVDPTASVGVHQHDFDKNTYLPAFVAIEDIQRGQGEVMSYLNDMGVDPLIMRHALATPASEIYILLPEQIQTYRLSTEDKQ
ncbi:hypothetical protein [Pelagimonas varians]|uniref:Clp protease n=1 Tax=Pelagimonas varians TaxID=696760 RepID=A0A238KWU7_9RHOB|nr:hypothetical protein [Pelagimonas varians]PYG27997.1 hypothetical protein C8N36_11328 [Pelagimonas varians]SMX47100.1 hypothetical protein PEV8663_03474 [Pelagimonas varians]